MSAKLYKTDGTVINILPKDTYFSLLELTEFVGGRIEILSDSNIIVVLNEEGKIKKLPINIVATEICKDMLFSADYLAGDVVVCDPKFLET